MSLWIVTDTKHYRLVRRSSPRFCCLRNNRQVRCSLEHTDNGVVRPTWTGTNSNVEVKKPLQSKHIIIINDTIIWNNNYRLVVFKRSNNFWSRACLNAVYSVWILDFLLWGPHIWGGGGGGNVVMMKLLLLWIFSGGFTDSGEEIHPSEDTWN